MKQTLLAALVLFALMSNTRAADIITQWTFNSNPPDTSSSSGTNQPATGAGSVSRIGGISQTFAGGATLDASSTDNSAINTASYPAQGTSNKTAGLEFRVSTVGYESIVVAWEHRGSGTASRYTRIQYSADGVNFVDGKTNIVTDQFSSQLFDLSTIGAVDNNPNFAFRIVTEWESTATGGGTASYTGVTSAYGTSGTIRYDLVTISGSTATGNNPPSITSIANQTIRANETLTGLTFTVGDVETPVEQLNVTPSSSNPLLIPTENILVDGTGASRTVGLSPAFFASGTATITLTVTDGGGKSSASSFTVTVLPENTGPSISGSFTNYHTLQGVALAEIPFTIGDLETAVEDLDIIPSSSNPTLIPEGNIVLGGTGASRTLTITPAAGQVGNAVITITVGDFILTTNRSFNVMVVPNASVIFNEPFDYPDGTATTNSGGLWANNTGTPGQLKIAGGVLQMLSSQSEDITARLIGSPYTTTSGTTLHASFVVNFSTLPTDRGDYFAHFRETGGAHRCRIFVSTTNSPAGTFRLGIANNNGNITNAVTLEGDLATGVDHLVVVRYDVTTGISTLWVNPTSESSPSVTATDSASPAAIGSFAFRESAGIGSPRVDNLKIGLALADVATLAPAVRLTITRSTGGLDISWPASATDDGYTLRATSSLTPPVDWQPAGINANRNAGIDTVTVPASGNRFFQLAK